MNLRQTFALTAILIFLLAFTNALPNADTERSGNLCERAHSFQYNYKFEYPSTMEIGKTYDLKITFTLSGSAVTRNPYSGTVKINTTGFDVSETSYEIS